MLFALMVLPVTILPLSGQALAAEPAAFSSWAKTAKIAGASLWTGMTPLEIDQVLTDMVVQKVTVIEADSNLSNYLTDAQFEQELVLMHEFSTEAHKRGLRVVWYYPGLEVLTPNGKNLEHTMYKDHPDWVQVSLDGQPNVFYGGDGRVHWVEKDMESAWMSPESPYKDYFLDRVRKIAATGIDGLWLDVPLFNDISVKWAGLNPYAVAKFNVDTGLDAPAVEDWNDPTWRRWIAWRHQEIAEFLREVVSAGRDVNPEFPLIVETVTLDYNAATVIALDGADLKNSEGITHVWEIDALSDGDAMRASLEDDWISLIAMNKFGRAASGTKPSWVFTYGLLTDDAELVMAEALATRNNPYETKIPEMTTTVGAAYRTRMFDWAREHSPYLFETESGAEVAVLYSSPSRDYVDQAVGVGLYTDTTSTDPLWWSTDQIDSAYERQYLAELRGMVKLLVHLHVPFDTVVNPADAQELAGYGTVILPDVEAISDAEASILRQYVQNGGNLVVTGPNPTGLDEYGSARSEYALADLLGFGKSDPLPAERQNSFGAGSVRFYSSLLGKAYFVTSDPSAQQTLSGAIQATSPTPLTTDADRRVHFELSNLGDEAVLQFVNFIGVDGTFSVVPTTFSVSLEIPAGKQVSGVALTSPDLLNTPALNPLAYTEANQRVNFDVALDQYALVVVSFDGAPTPQNNNTPIAGNDDFNTDVNMSLGFTDAMLLANDGDLDGDAIVVTDRDATNASGSLVNQGGGSYTYTPLQDFVGTDTLTYTISDGNGGTDSGLINILVAPPTTVYYPQTVTVTTGAFDYGTMASFVAVDADTYDINSAAVSGGRATDWYATTTISESPDNVAQITVTHIGQYNRAGVSQDFYVYNFQDAVWELVDTTTVGNEDDVPVSWVIDSEIPKFISAQGELQVRISGFKAANGLWSWSNALYWEVSQAVAGTPTNTAPVASFSSVCTDLACSFTDGSSDSDGTVTQWNWNFGDGNTSTEQSPSYTYGGAGTYTVSLTVTDDGGATDSVSQSVTVSDPPVGNQAPTAAFTETCTDLACNFTDGSSDSDGTVTQWNWNFGDGNTSTEQNPSHTYAAAGTYAVSLTVTDDDNATNTFAQDVTVSDPLPANQAPTAAFTSACNDLACNFTDGSSDSDGTVTGWSWDFGDGNSSTAQNPSRTYAAAGTYTVSLTVTDDDGATDTFAQDVTVSDPLPANQAPTAAFTEVCTDLTCNFTDGSSDSDGTVTGWSWDFGDGNSSTAQNPSHTYAAPGTYTVNLTVTDDDNATDNVSQSVTVTDPPVNQAPTAAFTEVCTDLTCNFTDGSSDSDGNVGGWEWDFGDGNSSTAQNPSHTYAAAGTYTVSLTVTDDDGDAGNIARDVNVTAGTGQPVEATLVSMPAEDGWVRESGENSDIGGRRNTGGAGSRAIRMGDNNTDRQYKAILSFDTASVPDGATILSARLELTRGGNTGTNPFNTHGTCLIDIRNGAFGDNAALENSDFEAAADAEGVVVLANQGGSGTTYTGDLADALSYVNTAGRTQLRLYFSTDDNDDGGTDLAGFYSADNSNAARRPRLIVEYQE